MAQFIEVDAKVLALCDVKAKFAKNLTRDETQSLMSWCDYQTESLWHDMTLQEILNVYRASVEYITWEEWARVYPKDAIKAWNRAVIHPDNKIK